MRTDGSKGNGKQAGFHQQGKERAAAYQCPWQIPQSGRRSHACRHIHDVHTQTQRTSSEQTLTPCPPTRRAAECCVTGSPQCSTSSTPDTSMPRAATSVATRTCKADGALQCTAR